MVDTAPLIERLTTEWQREADVIAGLRHPHSLIFYAVHAEDSIERRMRWFRRGWWLRLSH